MAPSMMVMPMIAKTNLSMKIEELGKDDFEMGKINMRTLTDKHEDDNNDRSAVGCDWRIGYHLLSTIRI